MIGIIQNMPIIGSVKDAERQQKYLIGLRRNKYERES